MSTLVKKLGGIEHHLNKKGIENLATDNAQAIIDSQKYDLLKIFIELKRYEVYLKSMIQCLKKPALLKASEIKQNAFEYDDAKVNIATRTKWDFSIDNKWLELEQQIQQLTIEKKERETYLKATNRALTLVDEETGEIIEGCDLIKEIEYGLTIRI
ncbi:MAG: hypothetical protein IPH93_03240 [Saprospiraceae bacterium]|nr:hypothetical protein [Saprospiraceae bacterium]MBK7811999.1 hypothetical protein [Saprospiraceae bacterium]MBK9632794.1 hypothetical protein [Saprospiraceae bacterium]